MTPRPGEWAAAALVLAAALAPASAPAAGPRGLATRNVVLITLDGARTQEIFGGLDVEVLRSTLKEEERSQVESTPLYRRFGAPTAEERRRKLLPFLWGKLLVEHGSIAGNRTLGSEASITNRHRFSYPGYAEILTGEARDELVKENRKVNSPATTVLELTRRELGLPYEKVAAFCSWDVLDYIVERVPGTIASNAGFEPYDHPDPALRALSDLQRLTPTPWDSVRHDVFTFRFAMAHLRTHRPRLLYIGLGETDDWSHDGRYDRTLEALARTDAFLAELWEALASLDSHRGTTSLIITTDHGRGRTPADWRDHGEKVEGAQDIWIAISSPDSPRRGEWRQTPAVHQSQIAATVAALLGIDFRRENPAAGKPLPIFAAE